MLTPRHLGRLGSITALAVVFAPLASLPAQAATTPFISEIPYDNTGTDAGEAIEVTGDPGADLTGWTVVLYNGVDGGAYSTRTLGTVPASGALVLEYPSNGIQNGSPDGLALVDAAGAVVERLSYEGTMQIAGATSIDIGVSETGSEPAGQSLQRGADGAWTGPAPSTFGTPGAGGGGTDPVADGAFVSEIHYDNVGDDTGEAIEITAAPGAGLSGYSVVLYNGSGGAAYSTRAVGAPDAEGVAVLEYAPNGIQNGSPDGFALVEGTTVLEFLSYEGTMTAVGGPAGGMTSTDIGVSETSTTPAGFSLQRATADSPWTGPAASTFGGGGGEQEPPAPEIGGCDDPATLVSAVQGSGATSPMDGRTLVVEAVVTSIKDGLSGYYVQEEAGDHDTDPTTSEGIFVRTGTADNSNVAVGQLVRVLGTVDDFASRGASQTQLTAPEVLVCDAPAEPVAPTAVTFPLDAADDLEHYEGMLVVLTDDLVISEYFNYGRFGEVVIAKPLDGLDRLFTPTAVVAPGAPAQALAEEYTRRIITLDDYNSSQNPATLPHPGNGETFTAENSFRGGDTITGVEGVIDHTFGLYRIQPTEYGEYGAVNPRPTEAPQVGGDLQVASFNVLNYFLTLDNGPRACGPARNQDCRGANSEAEFDRQRAKILSALAELDADVVGLMEMENTTGVEPAADLVAGLNEILGAGTYDYIDTGVMGTDAIRLGFLYKPGTVTPVGDFAVLDSAVDPRFRDTKNRPMLTQTFDEVATGEVVTVSVNHLKSKGSSCNDVGDPDTGDGQANCNQTRVLAAQAIVDFLATDPTGSGDPDHLVIGDLNSYDHEDPIDVLVDGGYTDLVKQFGGEFAYGYVFDGQVGYLDHALSNPSLTPQVTGAREWHVNADEPVLLDYNLDFGRSAEYFTPDQYRSSDHDAVLVGLDLKAPAPTSCFGLEPTIVAESGGGVVRGTAGDDVILAYDGAYEIHAGNGNDVVCAGDGDSVVYGGNGDDRVATGDGDDRLYGQNGDDMLVGGGNDDLLVGGPGDDVLDGGRGDDDLDGGRGSTTVVE